MPGILDQAQTPRVNELKLMVNRLVAKALHAAPTVVVGAEGRMDEALAAVDGLRAEIRKLRANVDQRDRDHERQERRIASLAADNERQRTTIQELRASGRMTLLEAGRAAIDRYGTPPPGEGRHPLQGHRDSMGYVVTYFVRTV